MYFWQFLIFTLHFMTYEKNCDQSKPSTYFSVPIRITQSDTHCCSFTKSWIPTIDCFLLCEYLMQAVVLFNKQNVWLEWFGKISVIWETVKSTIKYWYTYIWQTQQYWSITRTPLISVSIQSKFTRLIWHNWDYKNEPIGNLISILRL